MTNKLEIHGLDLTAMGIADSNTVRSCQGGLTAMLKNLPGDYVESYDDGDFESFVRQILGSITFGPVQFVDLPDPEDEDFDWEYAE